MEEETRLRKAFQAGLGLADTVEFSSLEFSKTPQWDSIAHMRLIAAIEEEFKIRLTVQDILGMSSYHVAQEIVRKHQLPTP